AAANRSGAALSRTRRIRSGRLGRYHLGDAALGPARRHAADPYPPARDWPAGPRTNALFPIPARTPMGGCPDFGGCLIRNRRQPAADRTGGAGADRTISSARGRYLA